MPKPEVSPVTKVMTSSEFSTSNASGYLTVSEQTFAISTPGVTIQRHSFDLSSYEIKEVEDSRGDSFFLGTNETWVLESSRSATVDPSNPKAPTIIHEFHFLETTYDQFREYHMFVSDPSNPEDPGYYYAWTEDTPPYTTTSMADYHTVEFL